MKSSSAKMQDREKLTCEECGFFTHKDKKLMKHIREVHQKRPLKCLFCSHYSLSQSALAIHKKREHRQVRLNCCLCEYSTRAWKRWIRHITQDHAGQTRNLFSLLHREDANLCEGSTYQIIQDERSHSSLHKDTVTSICKAMKTNVNKRKLYKDKTESQYKKIQTLQEPNACTSGELKNLKKKKKTVKDQECSLDVIKAKKEKGNQVFNVIDILSSDEDGSKNERTTNKKTCKQIQVENFERDDCVNTNTKSPLSVKDINDVSFNENVDLAVNKGKNEGNTVKENKTVDENMNATHTHSDIRNVDLHLNKGRHEAGSLDITLSGSFSTSSSSKPQNYTASSLAEYMKTIRETIELQCPYCSKKSKSIYLLKIHCSDAHLPTGSAYKCTICGYSYNEFYKIVEHMRTHNGEKPFVCPLCPYRSAYKKDLHTHLKVHTNERPFKCTMCDYAAKVSSNLKVHLRTHTKEQPFKCENCGRKFSQLSNLQIHIKNAVCR